MGAAFFGYYNVTMLHKCVAYDTKRKTPVVVLCMCELYNKLTYFCYWLLCLSPTKAIVVHSIPQMARFSAVKLALGGTTWPRQGFPGPQVMAATGGGGNQSGVSNPPYTLSLTRTPPLYLLPLPQANTHMHTTV